jgi:hypothetical protein
MKLAMKVVLVVSLTLIALAVAFVGVVVVTRPRLAPGPPNCDFRCDGYAKVVSIEPVSAEMSESLNQKKWRHAEDYIAVRLQYVGQEWKTVGELEANRPVFEMEVDKVNTPSVGKEVFYTAQSNRSEEKYFGLKWDSDSRYAYNATGVIVQPVDPMPWFHNKENSLGLAVFVGLVLLSVIGVVVGIIGWLVPIYIANKREHPNFMPIAVITILLGWTFVGWAVCLAWSLSKKPQDSVPELVGQ